MICIAILLRGATTLPWQWEVWPKMVKMVDRDDVRSSGKNKPIVRAGSNAVQGSARGERRSRPHRIVRVVDRSALAGADHRPEPGGARVVRQSSALQRALLKKEARHAVQRRPPLHERLAARVKSRTARVESAEKKTLSARLQRGFTLVRASILPHDEHDIAAREQSNEPIIRIVGAVDLSLLLTVAMLLAIGLIMVFSSSMVKSYQNTSATGYYFFRQVEWFLIGIVGMMVALRMDYHRWRSLAGVGLVAPVILLLLLHTHLGANVNGSTRWLVVGGFQIGQPSEVAKMGLVLYAAHWFSGQRADLAHSLRGLIPFGLVISFIVGLVLTQPDLGTTAVIVAALGMVYFVAGARVRHLLLLVVLVALTVKLYWLFVLPRFPYQAARWSAFLNGGSALQGAGSHVQQVQYALGTGGLTGVGLGNGQSKFTLPEAFTDSIFAILGEELGLVGTLAVVLGFMFLAYRGLRASILAPDAFGKLLAAGLTCLLAGQGLLNMAVVAGAVPFTGVPLPFISYGGSSLSISMVAAGILLNISKKSVDLQKEEEPAPAHLWWRNRRPHLSLVGRGAAPEVRRAPLPLGVASTARPDRGVVRSSDPRG